MRSHCLAAAPTAITGYCPMMEYYEEGGYEAGSSPFAPGCAEKLIDVGLDLMNKLK